jgi:diguanylate cyclase (GGDEF)-like protein
MPTADPRGSPLATFNEAARLDALNAYGVLDTPPEQAYDELTTLAASICRAPIALVSLVDSRRLWFKSRVGFDAIEIAREFGFCSHAILRPDRVFEVLDSLEDPRFMRNPLVAGGARFRFYAGAALITPTGMPIGTLCVLDTVPRRLSSLEHDGLASLARQVVAQLELRRAVEELGVEATTDALTGASNRRAFDRRLKSVWTDHAASRKPVSLLLLDIDHFKQLNDEFGHAAGDETLVGIVLVTRSALRSGDSLSRLGGEEFTVVLPDTDLVGAMVVAEKVRAAIAGAAWRYRPVTASIGVISAVPELTDDPYSAVAQVDRAMYLAKTGGRNCVRTV